MNFSEIEEINSLGRNIFSIRFKALEEAKPGQFLMIWVPGIKEVPMSISSMDRGLEITFKVYGEATKKLSEMNVGDRIFYRGPYGKPYPEPVGKTAYVAGGTGLASLKSLIKKHGGDVYIGARNKDELFLLDGNFHISTDDGSMGFHGNVVDLFLSTGKVYDTIYVCGPEIMMKNFYDRAGRKYGKNVYFSLERLMKCGIGICDSCSINGFRVCRDGPVFSYDEILKMDEFGVKRRTESGKIELMIKR
ncbi:MAG: dihydroorotate dehydrogenase electron transfer subunit [Thermoplasmata archaeon]